MSVQRAPTTRDGYVMLLCVLHTRTSTFFVNEKTQERHTEQKRDRKKWNKQAFALKFLYLILYFDDRYNFLYFSFHFIPLFIGVFGWFRSINGCLCPVTWVLCKVYILIHYTRYVSVYMLAICFNINIFMRWLYVFFAFSLLLFNNNDFWVVARMTWIRKNFLLRFFFVRSVLRCIPWQALGVELKNFNDDLTSRG